jgi:heme-degrading monooxygenase HmoA
MIVEHAVLHVAPGRRAEFDDAMVRALEIIESAPGCRGASVRPQIEDPSTYLLLVGWDSLAAHMEDFRQSASFEAWRALTHVFYLERPVVTHFNEPLERA